WPGWGWERWPVVGEPATGGASPLWWQLLVLAVFAGLAVLSWKPLRNLFSAGQLMNASFDRFHLVNAYGAFGSMTERRYEVIIEGTLAADPDAAAEEGWLPFEFKGKPGDVRRRSRQFAPYHLRLDWQMWFLALRPGAQPWFVALLERLRSGGPAVRRLLRTDPVDGGAPTGSRVRLFEYRYASGPERRETGAWWTRTEAGELARLRSCRRTTVPRSGLRENRAGLSLVPDRSLSPRSPMSAIAVPARRPVLADALAPHRTRLQDARLVLAGTGVVALLAQITLPLPLVPITGQTLGVILVGAALGSRRGAAALLTYLLVGVAGAPVFAEFSGGPASVLSPSFGF